MAYPYEIPSIAQIHPVLGANPNIIDALVFQGVFSSKANGAPLDPEAVEVAQNTVDILSDARTHLPIVTPPIIETARNRVHALREVHAALDLGLQPGIGPFVQQQFINFGQNIAAIEQEVVNIGQDIAQRMARFEASLANTRISSRNRRYIRDPIRPLHKSVDGNGHALALAICRQPQLPEPVEAYHPNAMIGALPNPWDPDIEGYSHANILKLVVFYNDDFGIVPADRLRTRRGKVRTWLLDFE
ncbi:hypothetical protein BJV78DRAFT_1364394 [Lactifluus subvellereus]|nr:hypothetical protein BJV78DRAFT_1364394 [Lactifluus subvellereus]